MKKKSTCPQRVTVFRLIKSVCMMMVMGCFMGRCTLYIFLMSVLCVEYFCCSSIGRNNGFKRICDLHQILSCIWSIKLGKNLLCEEMFPTAAVYKT